MIIPPIDYYEHFKAELDHITFKADMPAAAVIGECLRAAKRAQMVYDGELLPVQQREVK